ncbi:hypothetical protein QQX98_011418 [Neonectria punicea]|uniref:Uncharacterized protein n=1 Tax=Neonectria punicea TaxID=979145 RepID=A0ABR1GLR8_9HYPO
MTIGWDLPLLDIDSKNAPTTEAIRETVANLVGGAFYNYKPCKHTTDGKQIRAFARSGICEWFKQPGNTRSPEDMWPCDRQRYLDCTECGAIYAWYLVAGRITLTYRGIFNENNRHLLWCDSPGCATGRGPRWEDMVKEEIWLHHVRYGKGLGVGCKESRDYSILRRRSGHSKKCYRMPPHTLEPAYAQSTKDILREIKRAAE